MVAISSTPTMRHRVILFVETGDAKPSFPVSSVMAFILRESVRRCVERKVTCDFVEAIEK
jgi:hypothetical protein